MSPTTTEPLAPDLVLDQEDVEALLFDMDGVLTTTAGLHARAWKQVFDAFLEARAEEQAPFGIETDYVRHVDGEPRYEGVARFLASRGIELERGTPDDPPEAETICGLGNRKNAVFRERLETEGVEPFRDAVDLVQAARRVGLCVAVISGSRNAGHVLAQAGIEALFEVRVDGATAAAEGLADKQAILRHALRRLGIEPARAALFEDAVAGVRAGRAAGCGVVVGVAREGGRTALEEAGADAALPDLRGVALRPAPRPIEALPSARDAVGALAGAARGRPVVFFLDYDGTLTPIVERPEDANLDPASRRTLEEIGAHRTVAILSGRDLDDLRRRVGLDTLYYAGSHGFRIAGPDGFRHEHPEARTFLDALEAAERLLGDALGAVEGVQVERKRYAIAVHYRRASAEALPAIRRAVEDAEAACPRLRASGGRKVFEIKPGIDWDKGRALGFLLGTLGFGPGEAFALYVGDDTTDEDAFEVVATHGAGVAVRGREGETRARFVLEDPAEAVAFLRAFDEELRS